MMCLEVSMEKLYKLHRDKTKAKGEGAKLYLNRTIGDTEDKPPPRKDHSSLDRQPNIIPPTEFMALGVFRMAHN